MRTLIALTAAALLLLGACGDDDDDAESTGAGSDALEVVAKDFSFEPETIEAEPGQTLSVHLVNDGNAEHSFTVEELDADAEADGGEEADVEVEIPEEGGTFEFICRYHPSQMTGTIDAGGATGAGTGGDDDAPSTTKEAGAGY